MDRLAEAKGRIWLDATTTVRMGGKRDGTTRVELSLIRELPQALPGRIGFCVYDRTLRRFSSIATPPDGSQGGGDPRRARKRGWLANAGKSVERAVRRQVKAAVGQAAVATGRLSRQEALEGASPGDVVLLAGENWSRHDFPQLRRLQQEGGVKIAVLLQDMIPSVHPQFFEDGDFHARFQAYVDFMEKDADLVFAISDSTRNDFLAAAPRADPAKVVRIELGADAALSAESRRPAALEALGGKPFVLSVSTFQVRKNYDLLYRIWQKFGIAREMRAPHLVIVGREGWGSADLLYQMRHDPWIAGSVTILTGASDAELAWLYANCAFTLYPSWYEGWGLPLCESLAQGRTFIASDRSSLPEAGHGLGLHIDPYDQPAWEREILRLSSDRDALAAMERRIAAELDLPSWRDCADDVVSHLTALMDASA